jgi:hypothetical protein
MIELRMERGFVSLTVAASLLNVTRQRMHQLLKAGRIPGAFLMDCGDGQERWVVPRKELNHERIRHERIKQQVQRALHKAATQSA